MYWMNLPVVYHILLGKTVIVNVYNLRWYISTKLYINEDKRNPKYHFQHASIKC